MTMSPAARRLALTLHVTSSVGWLGAVLVFLGIGVVGLTAEDPSTVRGAYLVMEPAARLVLIPLAWMALISGIIQSLGTAWGLFVHYWVAFKLGISVFALAILLIYLQTFRSMASAAADPAVAVDALRNPSPVLHGTLALLLLLVATVLAIYKPRGLTSYGWRKQNREP